MAYLQDGEGNHPTRHQRHSPPSRHHDRESRRPPFPDSLPHRARHPEVQRPDDRRPTHSSHRRARLSEDLHVRRSMPPPPPPQLMARSATVTHRSGRSRQVYDDDEDDEEEERLRSRLTSRSVSKCSSRPSQTISVSTLKRSSRTYRSAADSDPSSGSSSRSSSADSSSSASTQDDRTERRLKERIRVAPAVPDPVPARPEHPRTRRGHRKSVVEVEESDSEPEYEEPAPIHEKRSSSPRSHRHRSRSPSGSRRHRHHRDHHGEGRSGSSSKRPHKRYYESEVVYSGNPPLSRSQTAPSSHVTSSQSMSSSSRRSSTFLGSFFGQPAHLHHQDKPVKTVECVVCLDDLPSTKAPKLKCGHRMCRSCLKRNFKISVKDPQHMPPKCCSAECIPLKHVDRLFDAEFKRTWNRKFAEFSTRNRIYCPGRKCGAWIMPAQIHRHRSGRKMGKCSRCSTRVCCTCNNKWHDSKHCPADEETNQILQQGKELGWQRCFSCREMVELKEGCNHMTCRCTAEFCMICGEKWKTCECPWFNHNTVEEDRLDHMQIPVPMTDHGRRSLSDVSPRDYRTRRALYPGVRPRPNHYAEEMLLRRVQEQRDEELARRLQYDDREDDYRGGLGDVVGLGNTAGHFMNDDYRRGAPNIIVPPPPPPPPAPVATFERANSATDYVAGVNRARGLRTSSMERRLADRFSEQRQGGSPGHRPFAHPMAPPPITSRAMGPPPPPQPPIVPAPLMRRHTAEEDLYDSPRNPRLAERVVPRRATTRDYMEEVALHAPASRRQSTRGRREPPKDSVLAGLTGQGQGMNRVSEWRHHVPPGSVVT